MFLTFLEEYPFILAFLLGLIPALVWMWFWLKEDSHPEPAKMLTLSFLGGMLAVLVSLKLQELVYHYIKNQEVLSFTLWATIEEVSKFVFVYFIALKNKVTNEPVDDIIYLIVSALGFVTLENALFLIPSIHNGNIFETIISSNLRFIGASLLHTISSATIGICMGLSFYKPLAERRLYILSGLIIAIVLHTSFNLFIINRAEGNIFFVFGAVWIGIIALLLLFEKVKHLNKMKVYNSSQN
ncbi:MAG: PrsW family glutamic-type intramembrane protease [Minisyncoccia bacterium]